MPPKVWYGSKTVWYNIITVVVFLATMFFGYQQNNQLVDALQQVFTNPIIIAAINFGLRLVTKQPVSVSTPQLPTIDSLPQ